MCIATLASRLPRCAHPCELCNAVTLHWIRWQNWVGAQRYFCDNECLTQWIIRDLENVRRAVALEYQPSEVTDV